MGMVVFSVLFSSQLQLRPFGWERRLIAVNQGLKKLWTGSVLLFKKYSPEYRLFICQGSLSSITFLSSITVIWEWRTKQSPELFSSDLLEAKILVFSSLLFGCCRFLRIAHRLKVRENISCLVMFDSLRPHGL